MFSLPVLTCYVITPRFIQGTVSTESKMYISIADEKGGMLNSLRQAFAERGWDRNGSRDHETQRPRQTPRGQSGEECKYRQTDPDAETQRPEYHYQEDGFDGTKRNGARRKDGSGFETKQQIEVAGVEDRSNWRKTGWVDRKW